MKASVCVTTFNEENTIGDLLLSLLGQSKKPDEIIIVDGGSKDQTLEIIKHYAKKDKSIRFVSDKLSRSKGRNLAVEMARNKIIAMTDAGCVVKENWLKNILAPFKNSEVDVVAGFYNMTGKSSLQKAFSVFFGVHPDDFDVSFLPSTRSIAFTKKAWAEVGGFPESLEDTAEDTMFNFNAIRLGLKYAFAKSARVDWEMPDSLTEGINKVYKYAKGDAKTKNWLHPREELMTHNTRVLLVYTRYLAGLFLILIGQFYPTFIVLLMVFIVMYTVLAFRKTYTRFNDIRVGLWGIALQYLVDVAVMKGFIDGIVRK